MASTARERLVGLVYDLTKHREIGRIGYFSLGLSLFAAKFVIDCTISQSIFGATWTWKYYLFHGAIPRPSGLPWHRDRGALMGALFVAALPFIYIGVRLTLARLRSAALPLWLTLLFFVPVLNIPFFALLPVIPGKAHAEGVDAGPASSAERTFGENRGGGLSGALLSMVLAAGVGGAIVVVSIKSLVLYGVSLFIATPFAVGLIAVVVDGKDRERALRRSMGVACGSILLLAFVLLLVSFEGLICVAMAAPIWIGCAMIGGVVGYMVQPALRKRPGATMSLLAVSMSVPLLLGAEYSTDARPSASCVRTSIEVDVPPQQVWNHVIAFPPLPPPTDWVFSTGVAYPISATIDGAGVGAVRRCNFTTGSFIEPITVWDPPYRLAFDVTHNPPPMKEWTLWGDVHPPHLVGFLVSERGQFLLERSNTGGTRLEGATWYRHNMSPEWYWRLWSDAIIHRIHYRVLEHIKANAETDGATRVVSNSYHSCAPPCDREHRRDRGAGDHALDDGEEQRHAEQREHGAGIDRR